MGADEKSLPSQSSTSSAAQKSLTAPTYLNWSAPMQAYYSSGTTLPPFFTSTAASTVGQPHLWGAQHPMVSQYGAPPPYSAVYSREAQLVALTNISMERKPSDEKDLIFMDINNRTSGNAALRDRKSVERLKVASGSENVGASNSDESACASSSQASDENANEEASFASKKRSFNQSLDNEANATSHNSTQQICENRSTIVPGKAATHMTQLNIEGSNASGTLKQLAPSTTEACEGMLHDHQQYTQDELEVKREKRKQSNRESARRSRLRKIVQRTWLLFLFSITLLSFNVHALPLYQFNFGTSVIHIYDFVKFNQAECEELQEKVDLLHSETQKLREELRRIAEECEKVTSENDIIMEELKLFGGPNVSLDLLIGSSTGAAPSSVNGGELNGHSTECK